MNLLEQAVASHRAGNIGQAIRACEAALRQRPEEPEALHLTATLYASAGEMHSALDFARRAVARQPGDARYLLTLGRLLNATGKPKEAEPLFRALVDQEASLAGAWQGLANALGLQSRSDDALAVLEDASRKHLQPALLREYARELFARDRLEDAAAQLETALQMDEKDAIALNNLGSIRLRQGLAGEAINCLNEVLRLHPDDATALANLGLAYRTDGRLRDALACFDRLSARQPLTANERASRASILLSLGRSDEALSGFDDALSLDADQAQALAGKAELLEWQGEYATGLDLLSPWLARDDCPALIMLAAARLLRRLDRLNEAIDLLESCLQSRSLDATVRRAALFTLGDLFDRAGRFREAFLQFQAAHRLNARRFDMDGHRRWVAQIIAATSDGGLAEWPVAEESSPAPVFIIGMPRSGTSLVEQILACHPAVQAGGERNDIGRIARALLSRNSGDSSTRPDRSELNTLSREYIRGAGELAGTVRCITDKMPLNFFYLGLISRLFPNARVVHCRRQPEDTALSCYFTDFIDRALSFSERLEDIAYYYKEYERLMAHWQATLDLPIHELVYEELVTDQEKGTRALIDFVGLAWDERCLRFHESRRSVHTASHAQVRRPIYSSSVGRSAHYRDEIAPLREILGS